MKHKLVLIRFDDDGIRTLGHLYLKDETGSIVWQGVSIELPYKGNQQNESAIPAGIYELEYLSNSPSFKYPHYWVKDVPGRGAIKIHVANYVQELRGCIAPGRTHKDLNKDGIIDIFESAKALNQIVSIMKKECGTIEIFAP